MSFGSLNSSEYSLVIPALSYAAAGATNVYFGGSFFAQAPVLAQLTTFARSQITTTPNTKLITAIMMGTNVLFLQYFLDVPFTQGIALTVASFAGEIAGAYFVSYENGKQK